MSTSAGDHGFDAVVLAGGRSSRLQRAKEDVVVGGRTLLEHTLEACVDAQVRVLVGPRRHDLDDDAVVQVREDPPFGGPVAALAAAIGHVRAPVVLVLACDMPDVGRAVEVLLAESVDGADAVLAEDEGRVQYLVGLYRRDAVSRALAAVAPGASMRSLLADLSVRTVTVPRGATADVDRPSDLAALAGESSGPTVADVMLPTPTVLGPDATVADVRTFFRRERVHLAIVADADRVVLTTLVRDDVAEVDDSVPAVDVGRWRDRWVGPGESAEPVRERMASDGVRRLVVVDADRRLLGLLCLKRRLTGFCSSADVAARRGVGVEYGRRARVEDR